MKDSSSCALVCTIVSVLGCGVGPAAPQARVCWCEGGPGALGLEPGHNFYDAYVEDFPDFGIVTHTVDVKSYSAAVESKALEAALTRCRAEFSQAYRAGRIKAYMHDAPADQRLDPELPFVRFEPKWIVVIVSNRRDAVSDDQLRSAYRMLKTGFVVSARDVLGSETSVEDVAEGAFADPKPLEYDLSAERPRDERRFRIIERFREHLQRQEALPGGRLKTPGARADSADSDE